MNSDLTRIPALLSPVSSFPDREELLRQLSAFDGLTVPTQEEMQAAVDGMLAAAKKPRAKRKPRTPSPAARDPLVNPQPGDKVSANGRVRYVLRVEQGHVYYNLGEADSRDHAVALAGWRSWCKDYGKVVE